MGKDGYDIKIAVDFSAREDGGLRATSPDVPGFLLSSANVTALIEDVAPALEHILKINHGIDVEMRPLTDAKDFLAKRGVIPAPATMRPGKVEFAGRLRAA